jgi:DNA-binding MarR family transcriptional regulator
MADDELLDVDDLAAELRVGVGMLVRRIRRLHEDDALTLPETAALARLDRDGPASSAELARAEQISPQSMGATVAALEARGLVARRPDPDDGRRSILTLTDDGATALRARRSASTGRIAAVLAADFTPAERARLRAAAPLVERLAHRL